MRQSWVWWNMPKTPVPKRKKQEDGEFKVSLGYMVRACLKN
jgi:hypothetical protein